MGQGEEILKKYAQAIEKIEEQLQQRKMQEDPPSIDTKSFDNSMMRSQFLRRQNV